MNLTARTSSTCTLLLNHNSTIAMNTISVDTGIAMITITILTFYSYYSYGSLVAGVERRVSCLMFRV